MGRNTTGMKRRALLTTGALASMAMAFPNNAQAAEPTAVEKANLDLVNQFCAAWKSRDAAKVGAFLHDNCVVRFTASRDAAMPVLGRQGVTDQIGTYLAGSSIEFLVQESYVKGPLVINRRVDTITSPKGKQDIQVVGVFFLRGGKIKEWLDFDPE
jgi:limonene-1,2-epoxide hydrolase